MNKILRSKLVSCHDPKASLGSQGFKSTRTSLSRIARRRLCDVNNFRGEEAAGTGGERARDKTLLPCVSLFVALCFKKSKYYLTSFSKRYIKIIFMTAVKEYKHYLM